MRKNSETSRWPKGRKVRCISNDTCRTPFLHLRKRHLMHFLHISASFAPAVCTFCAAAIQRPISPFSPNGFLPDSTMRLVFPQPAPFENKAGKEKDLERSRVSEVVSVHRVPQMRGGGHADVLPVLQVPDNKADVVPCERLPKMKAFLIIIKKAFGERRVGRDRELCVFCFVTIYSSNPCAKLICVFLDPKNLLYCIVLQLK
jgi:hypothetical protein